MLKKELRKDDIHSEEPNSVVFLIRFLLFLKLASFSVASLCLVGFYYLLKYVQLNTSKVY